MDPAHVSNREHDRASMSPRQSTLTDPSATDVRIDPAEIDGLEADLDMVDAVVAEMDRILAEQVEEPERAAAAISALGRRLGTEPPTDS